MRINIVHKTVFFFVFCFCSCNNSKKIVKPGDVYFPSYEMGNIEKAKYAIKLNANRYNVDFNYLIVFDSNANARVGNCICSNKATWSQTDKYLNIKLNDYNISKEDKDSCFYYTERQYKIKKNKLLYFDKKNKSMERLILMNPVSDSVKMYYKALFGPLPAN